MLSQRVLIHGQVTRVEAGVVVQDAVTFQADSPQSSPVTISWLLSAVFLSADESFERDTLTSIAWLFSKAEE